MPEEAATPAAGSAGATTTSGEKNKTENALTANKAARAGGPASTSYKVIDETSVTVPSKLPAVNRDAMSRPTGAEVAEAARRLDIDLVFDADLLYIAEELLMSPVPEVRSEARRGADGISLPCTHTFTHSGTDVTRSRVPSRHFFSTFHQLHHRRESTTRTRASPRARPVRAPLAPSAYENVESVES